MLRRAFVLLICPLAAWAEDVPVTSAITDVTLFPEGAAVTRAAPFTVPAGTHRLIATDLPQSLYQESLRITVPGVTLGAVTLREMVQSEAQKTPNPALAAAEAEVERLQQALVQGDDAVAAIRLRAEAAQLQLGFLRGLNEDLPTDPAALASITELMGSQGLAALQAVHQATIDAREADADLADLRIELADAIRHRDSLLTESADRLFLAVDISAAQPVDGTLTLEYLTDEAAWTPVYDFKLTRGDTPSLNVARGAFVEQYTGENWTDVAVTLSTLMPSDQTGPSEVWPWMRRIMEPPVAAPKVRSQAADVELTESFARGTMMEPVIEPAIIVEEAGSAFFDGLSVTYTYDAPLTLASDAEAVRISLGDLPFDVEEFARAAPRQDSTAFLVAAFTNTSGEPILPSEAESTLYVDGAVVGQDWIELIPAGDEAEIAFGPIEALRLTHVVEDEQEGDRGVLGRTNAQTEAARIEVQNLGTEPWELRLRDRVPVSNQEDLVISWDAAPDPTHQDVDDRRGVLEWDLTVAPGQTQTIRLRHELRWPNGQILR